MNRSDAINELAAALAKAQAEMKAALKASVNPHFGEVRGKYAGLPEVMEVAKALAKNGIAVFQPSSTEDNCSVVAVETILVHGSGQWMSEVLRLRPLKADPQGVGSAITYGRRYGLCSFVGIVADEDDDGNAASAGKGNGASAPNLSSPVSPADAAKTVADWKKEIADAPEFAALEKVGVRLRAAIDAGCLTQDHALELTPAFQGRRKSLNGKQAAKP